MHLRLPSVGGLDPSILRGAIAQDLPQGAPPATTADQRGFSFGAQNALNSFHQSNRAGSFRPAFRFDQLSSSQSK
jgi:hypothetical protein